MKLKPTIRPHPALEQDLQHCLRNGEGAPQPGDGRAAVRLVQPHHHRVGPVLSLRGHSAERDSAQGDGNLGAQPDTGGHGWAALTRS